MTVFKGIALAVAALLAGSARRRTRSLNLYSSRHYQTDEALYADFTKPPASRSTASRAAKTR